MQWTKAAARIDTLIRRGQYLTKDAMADFGRQEAAEDALPKEVAPDVDDENRAEQGEEADATVSAEESAATADAAENPAFSETAAYAVGDTVYLDGTPFAIEAKSAFGVQLRDPSQRYPIFRAESLPRFERLLAADERNAHFLPAAKPHCETRCLICPPAHPNSANQRPNRQRQKTSALRMNIWEKAVQKRNSVRTSKPFPC